MQPTTIETELHLQVVDLKKSASVFRVINHPLRQHILQLLHKNQQMAVTALYVKLRIEQSVASQHLAILRQAGLVLTKRDARFIFYTVNYQRLQELHTIAVSLISQ